MKLELGDFAYRITDGDNEGELTEYEDTAILESGGDLYVAFLDSEDTPRDGCALTVYKMTTVDTERESVEFDEAEEADDDDDDGPEADDSGDDPETGP